jgi:hypothetical protein
MTRFTSMEASSLEIGNSKKVMRKNAPFMEFKENRADYQRLRELCGTVFAGFGELGERSHFFRSTSSS